MKAIKGFLLFFFIFFVSCLSTKVNASAQNKSEETKSPPSYEKIIEMLNMLDDKYKETTELSKKNDNDWSKMTQDEKEKNMQHYFRLEKEVEDLYEQIVSYKQFSVPPLISVLKKESSNIEVLVINALGDIGSPAVDAAPFLIERFKGVSWHEIPPDAFAAREAIAKIGDAAIPALVKALSDKDFSVSNGARETLHKIGSYKSIKALKEHEGK